MTIKNGDLPAMPQSYELWCQAIGECPTLATGLTKRETMAMHMMSHLMLHESLGSYEDAAMCATSAADALLEELERTK